jgi:hypothetical protein
MADRVVCRAWPPIGPEEVARRLARMAAAAQEMRLRTLSLRLADAFSRPGPPMRLTEFAARLENPE